jgi:hypothetical protein
MKNKTRERYSPSQKARRQELKTRQKQRRLILYLGLAAVGIAALALTAFILINKPPAAVTGEAVPVMASSAHVPDGTDPGPYNSNPPSSGRHYAANLPAGFYDAAEAAAVPSLPEGYLVHSLEHGYVIFWYNCALLDEAGCEKLTGQLQELIDQENNDKVIAFPWEKGETPVTATTWGRMLRFEQFDLQQARAFVKANRNKAPEPNAD